MQCSKFMQMQCSFLLPKTMRLAIVTYTFESLFQDSQKIGRQLHSIPFEQFLRWFSSLVAMALFIARFPCTAVDLQLIRKKIHCSLDSLCHSAIAARSLQHMK
mmetsp:Transcript_2394/g.8627  ORF Transcript_2394/g.8627 Transcript_2394/m.8627 type:complete len:103 (+) Transcript_2394:32-340(+)